MALLSFLYSSTSKHAGYCLTAVSRTVCWESVVACKTRRDCPLGLQLRVEHLPVGLTLDLFPPEEGWFPNCPFSLQPLLGERQN